MEISLSKGRPHTGETKSWVETGARIGHFAKGVIYVIMGALALQFALGDGGQIAGGEDAARFIGSQPLGKLLLILLGVSLMGYAVWRLIVGVKDTEHNGSSGKGMLVRIGAVGSGIVNGALAVAILQLGLGSSRGGGGSKTWLAALMEQPFGVALVGLIGAGIVLMGFYQLHQAYTKKFLRHLGLAQLSGKERHWLTRLGQIGYAARGVVFPIIGVALVQAAVQHNPSEAKGMKDALADIASSSAGQVSLGLVAAGFVAYGLFMAVSAKYRRCVM